MSNGHSIRAGSSGGRASQRRMPSPSLKASILTAGFRFRDSVATVSTDRVDIREIVQKAIVFNEQLAARKAGIDPAMPWYPYDSIGNLMELRELLTDEWAYPLDLTGGDPVL